MSIHLQKDIERLKKRLLVLSSYVEESVRKAVRSVEEADKKLADEVIESDKRIDEFEVELEEDCLKILALHQPVAIDLRFVVAILKINNDLERIGDLSVTIAKRAKSLADDYNVDVPLEVDKLMDKVQIMFKKSLDSLVDMNPGLAKQVCIDDSEVDELYKNLILKLEDRIREDIANLDSYQKMIRVIRSLERIADHTTNIAEDVIYMIKGDIIRHSHNS